MNVNLGIWGKLSWVVAGLALVAVIVALLGGYLPLIKQNERMRQDLLHLAGQLKQETNTTAELRAQIEAARQDPKTVERLAREKLGFAKPGETVIRFEESRLN